MSSKLSKSVYIFLMVVILLIMLCTVSANDVINTSTNSLGENAVDSVYDSSYSLNNSNHGSSSVSVSNNTLNDSKSNIHSSSNNKLSESISYDYSVSNYVDLYKLINNTIKTDDTTASAVILLNNGNYTIRSPITWGNATGTVRNLTILGNNQVIDGAKTFAFMNIQKGYTLNVYNLSINNTYLGSSRGSAFNVSGNLTLINSSIENGFSVNGGAINSVGAKLHIENSNFTGNIAYNNIHGEGGVIFSSKSNITSINNSYNENFNPDPDADYDINTYYGGVMYLDDSKLNSTDDEFYGNYAFQGGVFSINQDSTVNITRADVDMDYVGMNGAFFYTSASKVTVTDSNITNCYAGFAGLIFASTSDVTLNNVNITDNEAKRYGMIYNVAQSSIGLNYVNFRNNSAMNGASVCENGLGSMSVNNCNITDSKSYGGGGALYCNNGIMYVTNTTITNSEAQYGGAIYANYSWLSIKNVTCTNNTADYGGAVYSDITEVTINNSKFYNNTATEYGGALNILDKYLLIITDSEFIDNKAVNRDGGALYSIYNQLNITSSLFENNQANIAGAIYSIMAGYNSFNTTTRLITVNKSYIKDSVFVNNYATDEVDIIYSSWNNITLSNNVFVNTNTINTYLTSYDDFNMTLNDNWWGVNNPDFTKLTNNLDVDSWIVMSISNSSTGNNQNINVSLNTLNNGNTYLNTIPTRKAVFTASSGSFNENEIEINKSINNTYTGSASDVTVTIDNQAFTLGAKSEIFMQAQNISTVPNNTITFNVTLNKDATGYMTILVNSVNITTTPVSNGVLIYSYQVPSTWLGKYNITYNYGGDTKYDAKNITSTLTVNENTTKTITPIITTNIYDYEITEIPTYYDNRVNGYVTPVVNQASSGSCWAFGSIASLESSILQLFNKTVKFSENQMKNAIKYYGIYGNDDTPNGGATFLETTSYYTSWLGVAYGYRDEYDDTSVFSSLLTPDFTIQDIYILPDREDYLDNDIIKEAIMKYGSLFVCLYQEQTTYYNENTSSLYNPNATSIDHLVCLVGWDDNYDASNFMETPPGNGAFIIKNSWDDDWGDAGYEYVSYYDTSIRNFGVFLLNNTINYTNIYQLDVISEDFYNDTGSVWIKNIYTAQNDETLAAIGTYILEKSNYTAKIYINNELKLTQSGTINITGYRTIILDEYFELKKGDNFTIELELLSLESEVTTIIYQVAFDYRIKVKEGQSYISNDGITWRDVYKFDRYSTSDVTLYSGAACLKAYTITTPEIFTAIENNTSTIKIITNITNMNITADVTYLINGEYLIDSSGNIIRTKLENNQAILEYDTSNFKTGEYTLTTILETLNEKIEQNKTISIEAVKTNATLSVSINPNQTTYFVGDTINIIINLTDDENNPIETQNITLIINGDEKILITNAQSIASLNYTINSTTTLEIYAKFNETILFNYAESNKTTITPIKHNTTLIITTNTTEIHINETVDITIQLKDENNNNLSNQNLEITINGDAQNRTTDSNGVININKTLITTENMTITVFYQETGTYNGNNTESKIIYKILNTNLSIQVSNETPYVGDSINITITLLDEYKRAINNEDVTLTVNNISYSLKSNSVGMISVIYNITDNSTLNISARFDKTEVYNSSYSNTINIAPKKHNTQLQLSVNNIDCYVNDTVIITAVLTDENANKLVNHNVSITINSTTYNLSTDINGTVKISYTINSTSTINIIGNYFETIKYHSSTTSTNITAKKYNTTLDINLNTTNIKINTPISILVTLKNNLGQTLSNKNVTINIDNKNYIITTDTRGVAVLNYTMPSTQTGKNKIITALFNQTTMYNNITNKKVITINYTSNVELLTSSYEVKPGNSIRLVAHITDNGADVVSGSFVFKFNSVTLKDENQTPIIVNVSNGLAILEYKIPDNMTSDTYNFTGVFSSSLYSRTEVSTTLTITKLETHIQIDPIYTNKDSGKIIAYIYDEDNNLITNSTDVTIKINGVSFKTTSVNGIVSYTIPIKLNNGTYNISIISGPKGKYLRSTANTTLIKSSISKNITSNITSTTVTPSSSSAYTSGIMTIFTGSFDVKPGDTIKLIAHISNNSIDVNKGNLVFKLNGVTLKDDKGSPIILKVSNGLAILEYKIGNLTLSSYNLTAVFSSNDFNRTEISTTLNLNLIRTHVSTEPLFTTSSSPTITAKIYDGQNKLITGTTDVTIKVNGVSFKTASTNGIISYKLPISLSKGVYDVTIISGPKNKYLTSRTNTVLIKS